MFPLRDTIPSRHRPIMTLALIAANVFAYLYQLALPPDRLEQLFYLFGVVPARYTNPQWALSVGLPPGGFLPFLSSMFLHGGLFHLVANMWTLWIFGDNVEDRMGPFRFLLFYVLGGLGAGLMHWATNARSTLPTVGASGAIAGVLGAYFLLFPRSRVVTLVPVLFWPLFLELPAVLYLGLWFALQIVSGTTALAAPGVGGVAWWAHVGGFLAGMFLYRYFLRRAPA